MSTGEATRAEPPPSEPAPASSPSAAASASSAGGRDVSSHHGPPAPHRSSRSRKEASEASRGTWAPPAAALHAARRNSSVVATRSAARARMRSGSDASTGVPGGSRSTRRSMPEARTGARDSMPGAGMPSAARDSISAAPGRRSAASRARARTGALSSSSRQGTAHRPWGAAPRVRWSWMEKARISSTSSPHSSTRSGWGSWGGNTSRMPPRTLICPRASTMSTLW